MRIALTPAVLALLALVGCGGDSPAPPGGESRPAAQLCPALGEKADEAELLAATREELVGLPLGEAEEAAEEAGCHVEPSEIDGEPQVMTREYDPTRISVVVRDGEVRAVAGFG